MLVLAELLTVGIGSSSGGLFVGKVCHAGVTLGLFQITTFLGVAPCG